MARPYVLGLRFGWYAVAVAGSVSSAHAAGAVSWDAFWSQAKEASPRIQVLKTRVEEARAPTALEVAPPTVAVGSSGMDGPLSGVMEQTYEIAQKVPFPSKFVTAAKVKSERVNQRELEAETSLIEFKTKAYEQFVDLAELLQRKQIIQEKKGFFEGHLKRLKAYTISDQVQQLHILDVEATLHGIEADLKAIESEEKTLRLLLGAWVSPNRGEFQDDPKPEPIDLGRPVPSLPVEKSPYLKLSQSTEELRNQERSFARSSWLPDLSLTYRRHVRKDNVMPSSHEVVVGIELPFIFPGQPAARSAEASLVREGASLENAQTQIEVRSKSEALRAKLDSTREQLKLMRNDILPNLDKRMHLLHRLAQTDMESIELHRSTYEQLVAGQERNLRLESDYRKALLEYETLLGGAP